jgi:hypothetical protein
MSYTQEMNLELCPTTLMAMVSNIYSIIEIDDIIDMINILINDKQDKKKLKRIFKNYYKKVDLGDVNGETFISNNINTLRNSFQFLLKIYNLFKEQIKQHMNDVLEVAENERENDYIKIANILKVVNDIFEIAEFSNINKNINFQFSENSNNKITVKLF